MRTGRVDSRGGRVDSAARIVDTVAGKVDTREADSGGGRLARSEGRHARRARHPFWPGGKANGVVVSNNGQEGELPSIGSLFQASRQCSGSPAVVDSGAQVHRLGGGSGQV